MLVASENTSAAGASGLVTPTADHAARDEDLREGEFYAVRDVSFELRRGECLGLIGHNGAGKTTLLKMLNGLIKPDRGTIMMRGRVRRDVSQLRQSGYEVLFHVVETEDEQFAVDAAQAGARILPLGCLNWRQVPSFLRQMEMVVSGRYHINIFAALAGVPFLPLSTNTGKMGGLLELLSPNRKIPVREWGSETPELDLNSAFLGEKSEVEKCRELAKRNFDFFI